MPSFAVSLVVWLRSLGQRFFLATLRVTAEEAVADLDSQSVAVSKRRLQTAIEGLDFAAQLPTGGDEYKERLVAAFRDDLMAMQAVRGEVLGGRLPLAEGVEALQTLPPVSGDSAKSSPDGSPLAIGQGMNGSPTPVQPAKRKRGRPKKEVR